MPRRAADLIRRNSERFLAIEPTKASAFPTACCRVRFNPAVERRQGAKRPFVDGHPVGFSGYALETAAWSRDLDGP